MSGLIDMTGQRFGKWTVLRRGPNGWRGLTRWWCRCDCGTKGLLPRGNLVAGLSKQCQPCSWIEKLGHKIGDRIGTRTLIRFDDKGPLWRCDCGVQVRVTATHLRKDQCKACMPRADIHGRMFTVNGETHSLAGWARRLGIARWAICLRIKRGMTPEAACTTPKMTPRRGPRQRAA